MRRALLARRRRAARQGRNVRGGTAVASCGVAPRPSAGRHPSVARRGSDARSHGGAPRSPAPPRAGDRAADGGRDSVAGRRDAVQSLTLAHLPSPRRGRVAAVAAPRGVAGDDRPMLGRRHKQPRCGSPQPGWVSRFCAKVAQFAINSSPLGMSSDQKFWSNGLPRKRAEEQRDAPRCGGPATCAGTRPAANPGRAARPQGARDEPGRGAFATCACISGRSPLPAVSSGDPGYRSPCSRRSWGG